MTDFVARLKLKGHRVRHYSVEGVRFRMGAGWLGVDDDLAELLRTVRENQLDEGSPLIFDVLTRAQAESEHVVETAAVRVPSPLEAPVVTTRSAAPRANELMIDGYAGMTAKQILRRLEREKFAVDELREIRAFESSHGKRITILRALDERIGGG